MRTSTVTAKQRYTAEDLLALPDKDRYELFDGRLVERNMGARSSHIGMRIARLVSNHAEERHLGAVLGADCGYQCFPDSPDHVRKPELSFIRLGRLPNEEIPESYINLPPDLAAEVLSPNDLA